MFVDWLTDQIQIKYSFKKEFANKLILQEHFAFFFDAFDEISEDRVIVITEVIKKFKEKYRITCIVTTCNVVIAKKINLNGLMQKYIYC
jgi:predicted NACHT family NTPase